ncbi:putative alpha-ketoglutarate-dependent sulfonate dioxygenase [Aspergillus fumigatus]
MTVYYQAQTSEQIGLEADMPLFPRVQRTTRSLDQYKYIELSPALRREYSGIQLSTIIDNDAIIRDLTTTAAEHRLKRLILRIGKVMGHLTNSLPAATCSESHEKYSPAYSGLKIAKSPPTGGDTLFISTYGLYYRHSEPFQKFAEPLTATYHAAQMPFEADVPRRHPENISLSLHSLSAPVVQTNPVTGWKSLFILSLIINCFGLQIRKKQDDIRVAIWDNHAVHHNPIHNDVVEGEGLAFRVTGFGFGDKPYLDPNSTSKTEL